MRVTSYREVRKVLRHPDVAPSIGDVDLPPMGPDVYYLRPDTDGLLIFIKRGKFFELHTALLPTDRNAKPKILAAFQWMIENAGMRKWLAPIKPDNRRARHMARACGMVPRGTLGKSIIYRGEHGRNC